MTDELERVQRRLDRERRSRREAERIAEQVTRDLYDRQQELELLATVADAANRAHVISDAFEVAVTSLCRHTGWPIGHAWVYDEPTGRLVDAGNWHVDVPHLLDGFRIESEPFTFGPGEGLPGRVLETNGPVWLADLAKADLPRNTDGLGAGFAFPIVAEGRIVAVIELFKRLPAEPDERLIALADQVGAHLSRVAERLAARDHLAHQSLHDALTGLPNRLLLVDRLDTMLTRGRRRSTQTAVLFLDADGFKRINETLGRPAGDLALEEMAHRLRDAVRASDTVARVAGDEFVMVCPDLADEADAVRIGEMVRLRLREPFAIDGDERPLNASIGIALARGREATPELLLRDAEAAMARAKQLGGDRVEVFDDRLRERIETRLRVERELWHGIAEGELRLVYQPVLCVDDGHLRAVEALVRWDHPVRGTVGPGDFLPVAEESGLILALGEWVLTEACRQAVAWRAELGDRAPLPINVNLAARQLAQAGFVETVERVLAETGARAQDLALEITESAVIENTLLAADRLDRLKRLGFQVLLDDFGTGYSSLSYLQRLPIDVLKIDRSFVAALDEGDQSCAIVRAIVAMADALGIGCVAEGVETAEQVETVRRLGCRAAQGYFFARPSRPEEIVAAGYETAA